MKKRIKLVEANKKVFMTQKEQALKKRLIALLRDDGKGHHHAKYAARLADFDIQIVPVKEDPNFTAAISFEDGIIYISEGFISNPSTFHQLNVLLRHELAHNLLMHEIRMMHKIGSLPYSHIKYSQSLHRLLNIIMDFEISNKKYSAEDKIIVKNMWLNGQVIGGLITEEHRQAWMSMSVEEMYDALTDEIAALHDGIRRALQKDMLDREVVGAHIYTDITSPCTLRMPLDKFINGKAFNRAYPEPVKQVIRELYEAIVLDPNIGYTNKDIQNYLQQIAKSSISQEVTLLTPNGDVITTLYTPEEKGIAVEALKNILMYQNQYTEWYTKVMGVLADRKYSDQDLIDILNGLDNKGGTD